MPPTLFPSRPQAEFIPDERQCMALWEKYEMLPNIGRHSQAVARVAVELAYRSQAAGYDLNPKVALAAGLLHDLAKPYTISYGGAHEQLGAAWVLEETGNYLLAQCVLFHVSWPWDEGPLAPEADPLRLPLIISYADKRARHDRVVSLDDRFKDLQIRYGHTAPIQQAIKKNHAQAVRLEELLAARLGPLENI